MKKIDKGVAQSYFKTRVRHILIYLLIWGVVSFGGVLFAEHLASFNFNGMPFHYFMGAQGATLIFILLLFVNAIISDAVDRRYGIDEQENERISAGTTLDH